MPKLDCYDSPCIPVRIGRIAGEPGPYCMSFAQDMEPLRRSISRVGVINPPIVAGDDGESMEVVIGSRRIDVLRELDVRETPCRVLSPAGLSPLDCLLANLYDNLSVRVFNDVEKGMVLNRLAPLVPHAEIMEHYMPLLGLPARESVFEFYAELEDLDLSIREGLAYSRLSHLTVQTLKQMETRDRLATLACIKNLNLNFNQQKQFIEYINDISISDSLSIHALLSEPGLVAQTGEGANAPQRARSTLLRLRERRFPRLVRAERNFAKGISELHLPPGLKIRHSPFFEGDTYTLELAFKDGAHLKQTLEAFTRSEALSQIGNTFPEESCPTPRPSNG